MRINKGILSILAVFLGLIAGAILMLFMGYNPIEGFFYLFKGGLMNLQRIGNTTATAVPLILTGLSVAFAFRTGLFNIGAPGQMLIGGLCALAVGLTINLPSIILLPMVIVAGAVGGALWGSIPGILKGKFNVHEVVSAIMMNWIAFWVVYYTIPAYFKGVTSTTESRQLPANASLYVDWLGKLFDNSFINLGVVIAILAIVSISFILNRTTLGYELKAVGYNKDASEYAGMPVKRNIVLSMAIAGMLAGLAGVVQYAGNSNIMQTGVMPTQGFDGIAVALLGGNTPIGVLFSALFFGLLYTGKGFMNAMTEVPPELADTIMATIIYFAATSVLMEKLIRKLPKKFLNRMRGEG